MGCSKREMLTEDHSESMSDALLFTTICIIGLPVDVHVRDGSVYSGIFHAASVDADYGVVLKKARMTKKGMFDTNVGTEVVVDTLVILANDLVQIVTKGVMLDGGNVSRYDEEAVTCEVENHIGSLVDAKQDNQSRSPIQMENGFAHGFPRSIAVNEHEGKKLPVNHMRTSLELDCGKTNKKDFTKIEVDSASSFNDRQPGHDKSKGKADDCRQKPAVVKGKIDEKIQRLNSSHGIDTDLIQVEAVEHVSTYMISNTSDNGLSCDNDAASVKLDDRCSERSTLTDSASTNSIQGVDLISESHNLQPKSVEISTPRGTGSTRNAKEFKLNPAAKIFSPSFLHPSSITAAVPTSPNMVYVPNSSPSVSFTAIQPQVEFSTFVSRPPLPVKIADYSNVGVGNGGSGSQLSQPIIGQLAHRTQPLRYTAHYTPDLSEPAYLQTSSPAVMVGRSGQLVYVHPVSHELVHGATTISPVSARPMSNHVQFPKQQGGTVGQAIQVCVPPPVLSGEQQSYALQSHIQLLQPTFPTTRPFSASVTNGFYGTKFS
ncbi:PREDICTED: uncharacterized protein LOC109327049 isoform X2 [Lupinus angustifolius]|uniref:uncharacterized protein LOC109327049 isoform X2 n=1 Tax=Lupinus angustifolius TaxID=3871 RepID=UPI00092F944B|nr:PREDICTED: uncharacterized protein LOC109327049 isoform X2 [Lupinus angustifolius]